MSLHSYSRCWIHLIWGTLNGQKIFDSEQRIFLSQYFYKYSDEKGIYMKINYVNCDHIHVLVDNPTTASVENTVKLLKGSSSYFYNKNFGTKVKLTWRRGYGAFSVSPSNLDKVCKYIANQDAHHKKKTFTEEFAMFLKAYNVEIKHSLPDEIKNG